MAERTNSVATVDQHVTHLVFDLYCAVALRIGKCRAASPQFDLQEDALHILQKSVMKIPGDSLAFCRSLMQEQAVASSDQGHAHHIRQPDNQQERDDQKSPEP